MSQVKLHDTSANCPQCRTEMVHVAVTPHPVVRTMQRNTFVCYTCKRTRTYMLPSLAADVPAGESGPTPAVSFGAS
jgi:transposase-like protein